LSTLSAPPAPIGPALLAPIMALAMGTPMMHTFSEFHSPKCWMFKDIGLEEWAPEFDATPATRMFEILMGIHKDYAAAQVDIGIVAVGVDLDAEDLHIGAVAHGAHVDER